MSSANAPLTIERPSWTFQGAQEVLKSTQPISKVHRYVTLITLVGGSIGVVLLVVAPIRFSATLAFKGAGIAASSFLLDKVASYSARWATRRYENGRPSLTPTVRAALAAEKLKESMGSLSECSSFLQKQAELSSVYSNFIQPRCSLTNEKTPRAFAIDDRDLSVEEAGALFTTAYQHDVMLHFRSLEGVLSDQEHYTTEFSRKVAYAKEPPKEAIRSFELCKFFVTWCLAQSGKISVSKANLSLNALAAKYALPTGSKALIPPLRLDELSGTFFSSASHRLILTSHYGESGHLVSALQGLSDLFKEVELRGIGFSLTPQCYDSTWGEYFSSCAKQTSCKLVDRTGSTRLGQIWQAESPELKTYRPSEEELRQHVNRLVLNEDEVDLHERENG